VEDITAKTGNFKKFAVFVRMLASALKQASDAVFVDLLTPQDLELLKSKRAGAAPPGATAARPPPAGGPAGKRYLILTYAGEFDTTHYPLPLAYDEHPDPARLKAIIRSLRDAAGSAAGAAEGRRAAAAAATEPEMRRLRDDNASLRQQVAAARGTLRDAAAAAAAHADTDEERATLRVLEREREMLRAKLDSAGAELMAAAARCAACAAASNLPPRRPSI